MSKGKLIILSGFSGSGKGTVVNGLLERYDDYAISISATTRNPREGEINGVHYYFKTPEEFQTMIDNDEFIEYATFVSNSYGTPKEFVEKKLEEGINVILEIEVQGALKVKEKMPDTVMVFIIFTTDLLVVELKILMLFTVDFVVQLTNQTLLKSMIML